jgi:hypothetical protein
LIDVSVYLRSAEAYGPTPTHTRTVRKVESWPAFVTFPVNGDTLTLAEGLRAKVTGREIFLGDHFEPGYGHIQSRLFAVLYVTSAEASAAALTEAGFVEAVSVG